MFFQKKLDKPHRWFGHVQETNCSKDMCNALMDICPCVIREQSWNSWEKPLAKSSR